MKIYGDTNSGNCLKVKWLCDRLARPYTWIAVETMKAVKDIVGLVRR